MASNGRYLEALAVVDDPTHAITGLNAITQRKRTRTGQSVKAFSSLSEEDQRIFKALLSGAQAIGGFRNAELREQLTDSGFFKSCGRVSTQAIGQAIQTPETLSRLWINCQDFAHTVLAVNQEGVRVSQCCGGAERTNLSCNLSAACA